MPTPHGRAHRQVEEEADSSLLAMTGRRYKSTTDLMAAKSGGKAHMESVAPGIAAQEALPPVLAAIKFVVKLSPDLYLRPVSADKERSPLLQLACGPYRG